MLSEYSEHIHDPPPEGTTEGGLVDDDLVESYKTAQVSSTEVALDDSQPGDTLAGDSTDRLEVPSLEETSINQLLVEDTEPASVAEAPVAPLEVPETIDWLSNPENYQPLHLPAAVTTDSQLQRDAPQRESPDPISTTEEPAIEAAFRDNEGD